MTTTVVPSSFVDTSLVRVSHKRGKEKVTERDEEAKLKRPKGSLDHTPLIDALLAGPDHPAGLLNSIAIPLIPTFSAITLPTHSQILSKSPPSAKASLTSHAELSLLDPYDILDSIDISDLPMDDNTPLGELPHPSAEVSPLHGDPLDVAPLQTLEPESSFSFDPPTVFTELELDIPRSI
nr:hypothetical protein Iba_chr07aCG7040 [Ipomoea batatas]